MRRAVFFFLALAPLLAQEVTWPVAETSDFVTRDVQGNWFTVAAVERDGNRDLRVSKFAAGTMQLLWTRVVGGSGGEELRALTTDADGALLLLGNTASADFPVTPGVLAPVALAGTRTAFLVKLDAQGEMAFGTYLHEGAATGAESLLQVRDGEIVLALSGRLWRIDAKGTRRVREVVSDWISGPMQLDDRGGLWVAGTTWSDDLPVSGNAFQTTRQSGSCSSFVGPTNCASGFLLRLDEKTGAVERATYLGGRAPALITGMALGPGGEVTVTGNVWGGPGENDFPTTEGAFQPTARVRGFSPWFVGRQYSLSTPFVARLSPELDRLVWATYLAGSRAERAMWIRVDAEGRAVVAGNTVSRDFPGTGAFAKPCGPDAGPNAPAVSFVARLRADGTGLEAGAILQSPSIGLPFADGAGHVLAPGPAGVAQVALAGPEGPVIACVMNGASFRTESFVAPGQLLTLVGAGIPAGARVLFDGVAAELLYLAPEQINAVVPPEVLGRERTEMAVEVDGVASNARTFAVQETNPTIKVFVRPDGRLEDRGNPLADVRLENGAQNGTQNPARRGEWVSIYATGIDARREVEVFLPDHLPEYQGAVVEEAGKGVQRVRVRIPETANGGVVTIAIINGGRRSAANGGFVWVE